MLVGILRILLLVCKGLPNIMSGLSWSFFRNPCVEFVVCEEQNFSPAYRGNSRWLAVPLMTANDGRPGLFNAEASGTTRATDCSPQGATRVTGCAGMWKMKKVCCFLFNYFLERPWLQILMYTCSKHIFMHGRLKQVLWRLHVRRPSYPRFSLINSTWTHYSFQASC